MLWSKTGKADVEAALQEMGNVVRDALDRLDANFAEGDLYVALCIFDLRWWPEDVLLVADEEALFEANAVACPNLLVM